MSAITAVWPAVGVCCARVFLMSGEDDSFDRNSSTVVTQWTMPNM